MKTGTRTGLAARGIVLTLAALTLVLAPLTARPALATDGHCTGGWTLPNELDVTDRGATVGIRATVSSPLPIQKPVQAELRRDVPMWPDEVVATTEATFVPLGTYEVRATVSKSDLGLRQPGDSTTIHVLFRIPGQPDAETCHARVSY